MTLEVLATIGTLCAGNPKCIQDYVKCAINSQQIAKKKEEKEEHEAIKRANACRADDYECASFYARQSDLYTQYYRDFNWSEALLGCLNKINQIARVKK